jgi:hypothetical protein
VSGKYVPVTDLATLRRGDLVRRVHDSVVPYTIEAILDGKILASRCEFVNLDLVEWEIYVPDKVQ